MKSLILIALAGYVVLAGSAAKAAQTTRTESCKATTEQEIASLFDRWNQSLQTGDPHKVVANYAERSILLPTVSNKPRLTPAEKEDYFHHFLEDRPSGKIDLRLVEIGCNSAVDAGLYTFTFAKTGQRSVDAIATRIAGMVPSGSLPAITPPRCQRRSSGRGITLRCSGLPLMSTRF